MQPFTHFDAKTVDDAILRLTEHKQAKVIAGGTDCLGVLKNRFLPTYPEVLVNIKTIPGLDVIAGNDEGLRIGALARLSDIADASIIKGTHRILADAAISVATPQIRGMATIGGNLCQDLRCWYYRHPHQIGGRILCLRKGGKICNALAGDNRYHSIFGGARVATHSRCVAVSPSDIGVALLALDARIVTTKRTLDIQSFFTSDGPGSTILDPDEVVTEIQIPKPAKGTKQTFRKFRLRKAIDFAVVSVASVITIEDGVCRDAQIALGAVAPTPVRATAAEEAVRGTIINAAAAAAAATAAVAEAKPLAMNGYKVEIVKALVKRAILAVKEP